MGWLALAQDCSRSADGGVARVYSLIDGWSSSYPETTGYIIPTFLELGRRYHRPEWEQRARRMLDWLVRIQLPGGGFQGGMIDSRPVTPVAFNTGQILLGLAAGEREFSGYGTALHAAARWLVDIQDPEGCWRKGASPFAMPGEKTYYAHVAWGLLEAARVTGRQEYADAAMAHVRWVLRQQTANGWLDKCCLSDADEPLTHTLGYALRGLLEAHAFAHDPALLTGAVRLADGVASALGSDGYLPGKLTATWQPAAEWACLTGTAQVAHCWFMLYRFTGDARYLEAGRLATKYVRRTLVFTGPPELIGAVRGSFPVDGGYSRYQYPNWAAKFLVDALVLEQDITQAGSGSN